MTWLLTIAGVVLIAVGMNDVFRTFVHPNARARLSTALVRLPWRVSRRVAGAPLRASGPIGIVVVLVVWVLLQVVGWALVYLPHVETGFSYSEQVAVGQFGPIAESLYMSVVVLATLGLGDVVITHPVLRLVSPLQALLGFVLLTACISWMLQLYPAISRRHAWALRVSQLRRAGLLAHGAESAAADPAVLHELALGAATIRVDLAQHAETYYFTDRDELTSLPGAMKTCLEFAHSAQSSTDPRRVAAARTLRVAIDDVAGLLRAHHIARVEGDTTSAVIDAALADRGAVGPR